MSVTRVLLADDHPVVLGGVERYLAMSDALEVVATCHNAEDAIRLAAEAQADVVVLDVSMPGNMGADTVRALRACGAQVVLFTRQPADHIAASFMVGGAAGFVSKQAPVSTLEAAILAVAAGETVIESALQDEIDALGDGPPHQKLTERESEIFMLMCACSTPKEVAFELQVAASTVYTHLNNIHKKLGVQTHPELVAYATRWSLFDAATSG